MLPPTGRSAGNPKARYFRPRATKLMAATGDFAMVRQWPWGRSLRSTRAILIGVVCVWGAASFLVACGSSSSERATGGNPDATAHWSGDDGGSGADTDGGTDAGNVG